MKESEGQTSQGAHYQASQAQLARANETMLDLLFGPNPITDEELSALIAKRPNVYGRFAGYLGKRAHGGAQ